MCVSNFPGVLLVFQLHYAAFTAFVQCKHAVNTKNSGNVTKVIEHYTGLCFNNELQTINTDFRVKKFQKNKLTFVRFVNNLYFAILLTF